MTKTFKHVGVVGSGTMGRGIAQVFLQAGFEVTLQDVAQDILERAKNQLVTDVKRLVDKGKLEASLVGHIEQQLHLSPHLSAMNDGVDLVVEAAPEDMAIKTSIFELLDSLCPADVVLASNTSSLSITAMGAVTKRPGLVVGMHFFNPPPMMRLVEIVRGKDTTTETITAIEALVKQLGKIPVIAKDTPGFIVNRVARSFYGEALRLLDEGVAPVEQLDAILREEGCFKMGPFELMDLIGVDINYAVTQSVWQAYFHEPRFQPHPIQRQMVEAGHLGRKTGRGFYRYDTP